MFRRQLAYAVTQNFTTVKLIHRSAWDFLEQDPRGQRFLQEASIPSTNQKASLDTAYVSTACVGLFVMQAYLTESHAYASNMQIVTEENVIAEQIDEHLAQAMPASYTAFAEIISNPLRLDSPEETRPTLENMRRWTSTGLDRLSMVFRHKGRILNSLPTHTYKFTQSNFGPSDNNFWAEGDRNYPVHWDEHNWSHCKIFLKLTEYILPQQLWSWLILAYGGTHFALGCIDVTYEPASNYLFDSVMYRLENLIGYIPGPHHDGTTIADQKMEEQYLDGLRFIRRLLCTGLDPNARASSFTVRLCSRPSDLYVLSQEATNWQRFLRLLCYLANNARCFLASAEVHTMYLALAADFLARGADANSFIPLRLARGLAHGVSGQTHSGSGCGRAWHLIMEQAATAVFDEVTLRTGASSSEVNRHFKPGEAEDRYVVREIMEEPPKSGLKLGDAAPRKVLRHFTATQQERLTSLAKSWLMSTSPDDIMDELDAAVDEICFANSEHVVNEKGWPWWIRRCL